MRLKRCKTDLPTRIKTPIAVVLTTAVADPDRLERVKRRNEAVKKIAAELDLAVIDFFTVSQTLTDKFLDGVHFTDEGYRFLAQTLVAGVERMIAG